MLVSASFLAVAVANAAVGSLAPVAAAPSRLQARQVNISVTCNEGAVDEVTVRPWTVRASRNSGDQVRWRLLQNSGVTSATIRPKSSSSWPFASTPPLTVSRNNTVDSGAITRAASSYFYDIVVDCGGGQTVIDPRMDIEP
jgi:hypothetical protein